jgi:uncharacterized protein
MVYKQLQADLIVAMKSGDTIKKDMLRMLISGIRNGAIASYGADWETKITDEDCLNTCKKEAKKHQESIDVFEKNNRKDLADKEKGELVVIQSYLPKELSDEELKKLLEPVIAKGDKSNFGLLMKDAMNAVGGKAGGGRVSQMLKSMIG